MDTPRPVTRSTNTATTAANQSLNANPNPPSPGPVPSNLSTGPASQIPPAETQKTGQSHIPGAGASGDGTESEKQPGVMPESTESPAKNRTFSPLTPDNPSVPAKGSKDKGKDKGKDKDSDGGIDEPDDNDDDDDNNADDTDDSDQPGEDFGQVISSRAVNQMDPVLRQAFDEDGNFVELDHPDHPARKRGVGESKSNHEARLAKIDKAATANADAKKAKEAIPVPVRCLLGTMEILSNVVNGENQRLLAGFHQELTKYMEDNS